MHVRLSWINLYHKKILTQTSFRGSLQNQIKFNKNKLEIRVFFWSVIFIYQFYFQKLMQPVFYCQGQGLRGGYESEKSGDQTRFSLNLYLIANINQQFLVTQQLIKNQFALYDALKKQKISSESGQSSVANNPNMAQMPSPQEEEEDFKFASENQDDQSSQKKIKEQEPLTRLRIRKQFKYEVDSDSENTRKQARKCETKNIIKNFVKSIFNFIRRHKTYIQRILLQHKIQEETFATAVEQMNGKINTIMQLRQFWCNHPYSNIFRIISLHFLKRYSLKHIFHSRISNHQIHLKYRCKLLESIGRPDQFTSLKDF